MKIQTILEKILTGKQVKFSIATIGKGENAGNKIIKVEDLTDEKRKFYIYHSLINFIRFKDWDNKIAYADIQKINKPVIVTTDKEKLYPIKINTEVTVPKKDYVGKDNSDDYFWYDNI